MNNPDQPQDKEDKKDKQDKPDRKDTEEKDLFHHGVISKLFPSNSTGIVRTESGREIPFSFQLVVLVGEIKNPADLNEGQEVGYDLSWTSGGLRVTKIKTYSLPSGGEKISGSEGEGGQGEDLPS